jgi:phosphonopyruvate decarboxylase
MLSREDAIKEVFSTHKEDAVYITNTGFLSRAIADLYPDCDNIFYMQGSMGLSPAIGLGVAMNTDKDVVVFVGDGSLLMHLGITHTIRDCDLKNLHVYVFDNGCHESVGSYKVSPLENSYPGIKKIYKITNDGKKPRVPISPEMNKENIERFLRKDE